MKIYRLLILSFFAVSWVAASAQVEKSELAGKSLLNPTKDSTVSKNDTISKNNSSVKKDTIAKHDPRKATRRSAIIPGWGQAYNKDYWKIPIVYGILAIPVGMYIYNNSYYQKTKFAYEAKFKASQGDTSDLALIDPEIKNLSISSLQNYRNSFRRDRDYAILWFILAWGLQVADATVFAHLNQFDVSNDLSMEVKPTFSPQTRTPGISLTMSLKNSPKKVFDTR